MTGEHQCSRCGSNRFQKQPNAVLSNVLGWIFLLWGIGYLGLHILDYFMMRGPLIRDSVAWVTTGCVVALGLWGCMCKRFRCEACGKRFNTPTAHGSSAAIWCILLGLSALFLLVGIVILFVVLK